MSTDQFAEARALGYEVNLSIEAHDDIPNIWVVQGFGSHMQFNEDDIEGWTKLVDPIEHTDRKFRFEHPDAATIIINLITLGHTVQRPNPLVDLFDVAGPIINETSLDANGILATAPQLEAEIVSEQQTGFTLRDALAAGLPQLEAGARNYDTLTAAQRQAVNKIAVRDVARLVRLTLHRLDSTGD